MKYFIILFSILLISAGYLLIREKTLEEYSPPDILFREFVPDSVSAAASAKHSNSGVIIFDISDLNIGILSDSVTAPRLSRIFLRSKIFTSTYGLSPDRSTSLKSFLECLAPYKSDDGKNPYSSLKKLISDSLRNSSVPQQYGKAGYITKYFTSDSLSGTKIRNYFSSGFLSGSKEKVLEELYSSLTADFDTAFFYYADLTAGSFENINYFTDIDHQVGSLLRRVDEKLKIDPLILFISTKRSEEYKDYPAFFFSKRIQSSRTTPDAALTDLAKTLLGISAIKPPNYFSGYDADNNEEFTKRDYFAGSSGDTLVLFNQENAYKQLKHSPEYFYHDLVKNKDITDENVGINEKFVPLLPNYFGGDYAKFIILKNRSDKPADFNLSIRSNRRFEEFKTVSSYYKTDLKNGRYIKDFMIGLSPGSADTLIIYYSHLYQNFDFSFGAQYGISYGSAGINAGNVKSFEENSYYGMKYFYEGDELYKDYDIRIYNTRINY